MSWPFNFNAFAMSDISVLSDRFECLLVESTSSIKRQRTALSSDNIRLAAAGVDVAGVDAAAVVSMVSYPAGSETVPASNIETALSGKSMGWRKGRMFEWARVHFAHRCFGDSSATIKQQSLLCHPPRMNDHLSAQKGRMESSSPWRVNFGCWIPRQATTLAMVINKAKGIAIRMEYSIAAMLGFY